jgi:RNA polymerase sigma-70 factor, ECF subfamily
LQAALLSWRERDKVQTSYFAVSTLYPEEFQAAAARWPDIGLDGRAFDEYVRQRAAPLGESEQAPARTPQQIEALFLCCACARGNQAACRFFKQTYETAIRRAIARIEPDRQFVDEVAAQVFDKLLVGPDPRVVRYGGRGELSAWLKVVASRAALDAKPRRQNSDEEPLPSTAEIVMSMSPESMVLTRLHAQNITDALEGATARLGAKEREILRLHYADGLNIDEIGALHGVHRATVARWLQRARATIDSGVREELEARHGLGTAEVTTLINGASGVLQETLRALLGVDSVGKDFDRVEELDLTEEPR